MCENPPRGPDAGARDCETTAMNMDDWGLCPFFEDAEVSLYEACLRIRRVYIGTNTTNQLCHRTARLPEGCRERRVE